MNLGKYSIGIGDRFSHQGVAQLSAIVKANKAGLDICPVWNKSNRENILWMPTISIWERLPHL